jgi:hypothetical protein
VAWRIDSSAGDGRNGASVNVSLVTITAFGQVLSESKLLKVKLVVTVALTALIAGCDGMVVFPSLDDHPLA